ncbi:hypothetical protein CCB80_01285 [Armatimonadetes bacterium Uphvl-Ar1]|nr:hypothetical protein CCB80_01285 [Armatimonadetes bacterium Uphvl-Ar1]
MQSSLFDSAPATGNFVRREARLSSTSCFETTLGLMVAETYGGRLTSLKFVAEGRIGIGCALGERVAEQMGAYLVGDREEFDVPLRLMGTPFQVRVWKALQDVPFGATVCYSDLAERLGVRNGQRAVGMANRVNPVAVIVPCHRVIQADGQLCGYAGGLWRKQQLLGLESGQRGLF